MIVVSVNVAVGQKTHLLMRLPIGWPDKYRKKIPIKFQQYHRPLQLRFWLYHLQHLL
jgi:hypothetical protein